MLIQCRIEKLKILIIVLKLRALELGFWRNFGWSSIFLATSLCITHVEAFASTTNQCEGVTEGSRNYSINLMWFNRKKDDAKKYIFDADSALSGKNSILGWEKKNPHAQIYFWYDSDFVSPVQIANTKGLFDKIQHEAARCVSIEMKDVREIPIVKKNSDIFSENMSIFFRVDILRLITTLYLLEPLKDSDCFLVYADLDIPPLDEKELFDPKTIDFLNRFGMVVAQTAEGDYSQYENYFHIASAHRKNMLIAIQTIIDVNIERARRYLSDPSSELIAKQPFGEAIWYTYPLMFEYFYHLEGLGTLYLDDRHIGHSWRVLEKIGKGLYPEHGWLYCWLHGVTCYSEGWYVGVPYDRNKHGLEPFGTLIWMTQKTPDNALKFRPNSQFEADGYPLKFRQPTKYIPARKTKGAQGIQYD